MFTNTNRTGFGGNTTAFGSPAPANPFGASQMFGASTSTFGSPGFGQAQGNVFGAQPAQPQNQLFSTANTSTFGAPPQNAFGSTPLFGQQAAPASNSLFMGSTPAFGAQAKQPGYSFPTPQSGLFGQASAQPVQQSSNMFQPSTSGNIFGTSSGGFGMQVQPGTTVKFQAVTGTDSMQKSGATTVINTKHHCITCMKEYESKSFEELRLEDYTANRKGPQAGSFGQQAQPFASTSNTGIFGQTADANKTAFGQTNTFGSPAPAFGNTQSSNIFGKPQFGSPITTSSSGGFGSFGAVQPQQQTSTSIFGAPQQAKPFGQAAPLFGSQPQPSSFGATPFFGQTPATQSQSFFNKPAQPTFSTPQAGFAFGQTQASATQATGLFQAPKPTTGFSLFNNSTTTTTTSAWPTASAFGTNAFAKPAQPAFGQPTQPSFGTGLMQQNLFGTLGAKPSFGTQPQTNIFGNTSLQQTPGFGMQQQQMAQPVALNASLQLNDFRSMIANCDPYGYSPHLDNLDAFKPSGTHYVTNPKDIDNYLKETENNIANTVPKSKKIQVKSPCSMDKWKMFEASYDNDESPPYGQVINKSVKRLTIRRDSNLRKPEPIYVVKDGRLIGNNSGDNIPITSPPKALQISRTASAPATAFDNRPNPSLRTPQSTRSAPEISTQTSSPKATESSTSETLGTESIDGTTSRGTNMPRVNMGVVNIDSLDDTSQQKSISSTDVTDTCGVICTRPQYYTLPSLDKLAQFKNPDGACYIKGFTIGRHGYGNVHFDEVINVASLNIDELVHFRHKQICIYMDDTTKPPVGEGLNRPAQVTLDRVFPSKDPKEGESLGDVHDPHVQAMAEIEFEEVLRRACGRAGTTFVDYRPETGSWVFNVYHFSKYDLLDTDEADIRREALQESRKPTDGSTEPDATSNKENELDRNVEVPVQRGLGGVVMDTEPTDEISVDDETTGCFGAGTMDYDHPFGTAEQRSYTNIGGMDHYEPSRWEQDRIPKRNMQLMQMKYMFYNDDPIGREKADKMIEVVDMEGVQSTLDLSVSPGASTQLLSETIESRPRDMPKRFVLLNGSKRVPMNQSLLVNRGVMDAAIFKGRSFKCGWGAGLKLYGLVDGNQISEVQVSEAAIKMQETDADPFRDHAHLSKFINLICKETALQLEHDINGDTIPFFQMIQTSSDDRYQCDDESLLLRLFNLSENILQKNSSNKHMAYYHSIWKLLLAFWGSPMSPINVEQFRRDVFNEWLEHVTAATVNDALGNQSEQTTCKNIVTCLSGHQITEAIELATSSGYPQLSLLIAQLNSPVMIRSYLHQQLVGWFSTGALELISEDIQRLYMLCAGLVKHDDINIMEGLDWLRCLAMYFWYVCPSSEDVDRCLRTFELGFDKYGNAAQPNSKYSTIQDTWDILFHIMKLYCNNQNSLEVLLSPQTHTTDPNDYRLSWLLQQVFLSMGVGRVTDECHNQTTTSFATQLEEYEQYKWSIFVLLHLKDTIVRKNLVMAVLDRQLSNMDGELEEYIVENFHIPSAWMHEVKAAQTKLLSMHWQAYKHLNYSRQSYDCHELLINELAPALVSNHEFEILNNLLEDIEADQVQITRWKYQGGLIMQFIRFWQIMQNFYERQDIPLSEVTAIQMKLNQMLAYLRSYPVKDFKQAMVVSEMSKYCASFYTTLLKYMRVSDQDACEFSNQFSLIVMPFDYKYAEINKFIGYSKRL